MNFLLDTNIFIKIEPTETSSSEQDFAQAIVLIKKIQDLNHQVFLHPQSKIDIGRDKDPLRKKMRQLLVNKYKQIPNPPCSKFVDDQFPPQKENDAIDNALLASVIGEATDYLITEDKKLYKKSVALNVSERVLTINDALSLLENLFPKEASEHPLVEKCYVHNLDILDPLFDALKQDYPKFSEWISKCKREHREAFVVKSKKNKLAALCIYKREETHPIHTRTNIQTLKLCTFKVSDEFKGQRYGELLLKAALEYANINNYSVVYMTAKSTQDRLISFAEDFGFHVNTDYVGDDLSLIKNLKPSSNDLQELSNYELHIKYGPFFSDIEKASCFIVPVQPQFHNILFPEYELQQEMPFLKDSKPCGNSIKKAYLCHANIKTIKRGDNLVFYRSEDVQGITSIGIVENTMRTADAREALNFVGKRTVYSYDQIQKLCKKTTLLINFRQVQMIDKSIGIGELIKNGILNKAPQSINQIRGNLTWLKTRVAK